MSLRNIFVFDTNVLISASLLKNSISAQAYDHAVLTRSLAISEPLLQEFTDVLLRKKLDKYFFKAIAIPLTALVQLCAGETEYIGFSNHIEIR